MTTATHDKDIILVGVDGSPTSLRAIRWAIDEARLRGCAIEAVTVWQPDSPTGPSDAAAAQELQQRVLRDVTACVTPEPLISGQVENGSPADVLVRRSEDASLLVVGSHSVGSMRHTALGSTSDYCSRMAVCPVVVLPIQPDRPHEDPSGHGELDVVSGPENA
ncbi:universal stress protein [Flexivirga caeni]|uniref:Universal stress protein n=1 Tax=Flexivirga caeni TaxID=2294115 RepID=A0A3M9MEC0_9MICO|nr:universal stress protein [Flexivirga caeni]RNI23834.1 universal stress protein [Flexivirga caeni]